MRTLKRCTLLLALPILLLAGTAQADLIGIRDAEITMLRVHDVGTGFGPPADHIDVEVVMQVAGRPGAFGFQLRDDRNAPARQGMLDLLRDAMINEALRVNFDYEVDPPKRNGVIIRVWLTRAGN